MKHTIIYCLIAISLFIGSARADVTESAGMDNSAVNDNDSTALKTDDGDRTLHRLEFSLRGAYVLPTSIMLKGGNAYGKRTDAAYAAAAEYAFTFPRSTRYGKLYPYAYQGAGISVNGFSSNKITGTPVNIYVLQGSRIASFTDRLSLDYEWNFGLSAGWKKVTGRDVSDIYSLDGFGSHFNAYIDLGFKLNYILTDHFSLTAGVNLSHYSNGNTDYPNPGINVLWGKIGLVWHPGSLTHSAHYDWGDYERHVSYDITAYGAWRKYTFNSMIHIPDSEPDMNVIPGHFGLAGLNLNPLWHFNPILSAGASLDFQYDEGANLNPYYVESSSSSDPKFFRQPFTHRLTAGLSARVELQMPVFCVNIGIGHSLYAPGGQDLRGWYQTFTLKTFITHNLYLSTGYRLVRFKRPGNLMLGIGWRFNAR